MSRHRNVRSMNYQDEYDGYDDVYGHSVEDGDFCVSPGTAHYLSDRHNQPSVLGAFMGPDKINEEDEGTDEDQNDSLQESSDFTKPTLSDIDQARLNSCLEEMRNILGDSTPEHIMTDAVIKSDFNFEKAISIILAQQEAPKPQRERRTRKNRDAESGSDSPGSCSPASSASASPQPVSSMRPHPDSKASKKANESDIKLPLAKLPEGLAGFGKEWKENKMGVSGKSGCGFGNLTTLAGSTGKAPPSFDGPQIPNAKSQLPPGGFSLASLAQQYKQSESPPELTGTLGVSAAKYPQPSDPMGLSLSMLAQQQQQPKSELFKAAATDGPIGPNSKSQTSLGSCPKQLSLSDLAREQHRSSLAELNESASSMHSLAGSFMKTTDSNVKAASGFSSLSDNLSASSSRPIACPGVSLGAFAQEQQQLKNSSSSPSFQGSPSLSDLARQHMDGKGEEAIASSPQQTIQPLAALSGHPTSDAKQNALVHNFSLSSFIQHQGQSKGETPSLSNLSSQHLEKDSEKATGKDPQFSLAALAQSHNNNNTKSFTPGSPTGVNENVPPPGFKPTLLQTDRSKPNNQEIRDSIFSQRENTNPPTGPKDVSKKEPGRFSLADLAKSHTSNNPVGSLPVSFGSSPPINPPPGFGSPDQTGTHCQRKPSPTGSSVLGTISLADLASRHGDNFQKDSTAAPVKNKCLKVGTVRPFCVLNIRPARPSLFGQALCVGSKSRTDPTVLSKRTHRTHPKFSYNKQIFHDAGSISPAVRAITPFSFSTPSPDDLIKAKQRGAFTRNGERVAANAQPTAAEPPFLLRDPPKPKNVIITKPEAAPADQQPARMTFSTSKKVASGFTPDKDGEGAGAEPDADAVEAVRRNLEMEIGVRRGSEQLEPPALGSGTGSGSSSRSRSPAGSANATPKKEKESGDGGAAGGSRGPSQSKDKLAALKEYEKRSQGSKTCINLVVIGHVDAGKSTLMGHTLVQLGFVNKKTIHKYEQESKKLGKASFAFAWVLDETEEERSRGVTMDVAQTRFETDSKVVTLLDAPGHKDFIPNMITGAAQADVAILVVNSTRGEFETGFEAGGQTREHAMLIRSLGVSQLCVAINKMDTVEWDKQRYDEITKKLGSFLKTAGFRESDVAFVPCSGLSGENLTKPPTEEKLAAWYSGPSLVQQIDQFKPPERPVQKAFRMCIADVFKGMGSGFSVAGMVQAGTAQPGEKVLVMPQGETANIKSVTIDDVPMLYGFAGDNITLTLTGIDLQHLTIGSILCDPKIPIAVTSKLRARVVIFNIDVPLTQGFPVVFHYGASSEPAHIRKLVSQLHKSTGEVVRKKPRCLTKNSNAVIEIELSRPICIELYKDYKDLGRFMLRYSGSTIAAGLVTEILKSKGGKAE